MYYIILTVKRKDTKMGMRVKSSNKETISLRQYAGFGGARLSILTVRNPRTNWMQSSDDMNCVNLSREEALKLAKDLLAWADDSIEQEFDWPLSLIHI